MRSDWRGFGVACVVIAAAVFPAYGQFFQEGNALVGTAAVPDTNLPGMNAAALSADGSTAAIGYSSDNRLLGAAWIFTHSGAGWAQQGGKLVPNDVSGPVVYFGTSAALSSDGNTALIGGPLDNGIGAAWVFTRCNGIWSQQGSKLVGTGVSGTSADQGASVALSADGNTAVIGGPRDNLSTGAAWVFHTFWRYLDTARRQVARE